MQGIYFSFGLKDDDGRPAAIAAVAIDQEGNELDSMEARIPLESFPYGDWARVIIEDEGMGMPEFKNSAEVLKLFQDFCDRWFPKRHFTQWRTADTRGERGSFVHEIGMWLGRHFIQPGMTIYDLEHHMLFVDRSWEDYPRSWVCKRIVDPAPGHDLLWQARSYVVVYQDLRDRPLKRTMAEVAALIGFWPK